MIRAGGERRLVVVMVTSSYPRFAGDTVATFLEPIARGVAARGHEVHVVLPWHPHLKRAGREEDLHFHPFRYAPLDALNVFGYAGSLEADVRLRLEAYAVAPLALAAGWLMTRNVARCHRASLIHGHWVVPGGALAAAAAGNLPVVVSLHGSDVYLAERLAVARAAARAAFSRADWITACSDDLRERAIAVGAPRDRSETIAYGVDAARFQPDPASRPALRRALGVGNGPLVFTAGRFVRKKGFEYLIDAVGELAPAFPELVLAIAGGGDLEDELRRRASARGIADATRFVGVLTHSDVARFLSAADVVAVPSVVDEAGNVDGLPNVVMEAMASGTPLVATTAGGIPSVIEAGRTAELVPEGDAHQLAMAIDRLLRDPARRSEMGRFAREEAVRHYGWDRFAARLDSVYERAVARRARAI